MHHLAVWARPQLLGELVRSLYDTPRTRPTSRRGTPALCSVLAAARTSPRRRLRCGSHSPQAFSGLQVLDDIVRELDVVADSLRACPGHNFDQVGSHRLQLAQGQVPSLGVPVDRRHIDHPVPLPGSQSLRRSSSTPPTFTELRFAFLPELFDKPVVELPVARHRDHGLTKPVDLVVGALAVQVPPDTLALGFPADPADRLSTLHEYSLVRS